MATTAELRNISPTSTTKALRMAFPSDGLATALRATRRDTEFMTLSRCRNLLIHRATPGRLIRLYAGAVPAVATGDAWKLSSHGFSDVELGPSLSRDNRTWLAGQLKTLVAEANAFLARRGVP